MNFRQNNPGLGITPICKNLIIINVVVYFIMSSGFVPQELTNKLSLHLWGASDFMPFQFLTYMFMHGSLTHLALNMFSLWMFGSILEHFWGVKKFLTYYFVTGIGGALLFMFTSYIEIYPFSHKLDSFIDSPNKETLAEVVDNKRFETFVPYSCYFGPENTICQKYEDFQSNLNAALQGKDTLSTYNSQLNGTSIADLKAKHDKIALDNVAMYLSEAKPYWLNMIRAVGASGAIFGLLLAFGMMFPEQKVYFYMLFPIKAKYFVVLYGLVELYMGIISYAGDNIAHFAHLGGMLFGWILIKKWKSGGKLWR